MLYAICANNPSDKNNQYIEQVWKAINYYDELLQNNIPKILILIATKFGIEKVELEITLM
jgi:hypothetical protein